MALIKMPRMNVPLDNGVELEDAESVRFRLGETVQHKLLADMASPTIGAHDLACVCDVSAPSHVVGMKDVKTGDPIVLIHSHADMRL